MPIGSGEISLTKHYSLEALVQELASVDAGMSRERVRQVLEAGGHAHGELFDDLIEYDSGGAVEDELLRACHAGEAYAKVLVWVALVLADPRVAITVESLLTRSNGRLDPARFTAEHLREALQEVIDTDTSKAASNLLRYFETAGIVVPTRHGTTIVGITQNLPTSHAVPAVVCYVREKLASFGVLPGPAADPIELALALGANHWLNLTPEEFRVAARGTAVVPLRSRKELPDDLQELHTELRRKRQVILQGPPGTGKTFVASRYVTWATADDALGARLSALSDRIPAHERTAERIVEEVVASGAPAIWEIVQFHPSYTYEDFVRGLQAEPLAAGVTFAARNKVLGLLAAVGRLLAQGDYEVDLILVIDEINRGDISKIFGELIYALEYRGEPVSTPYDVDGETLELPERLYIIGTMNTADRSIAVVDYALRRRFVFIDVEPNREVIASAPFVGTRDRDAALWLFDQVSGLFDDPLDAELRELRAGHSYFLPQQKNATEEEGVLEIGRRFAYEVYPLLAEYETEGRFGPDKLDALLATLGVAGDRPRQAQLAADVSGLLLARG